jgi:hypothetical protein
MTAVRISMLGLILFNAVMLAFVYDNRASKLAAVISIAFGCACVLIGLLP